MRRLALLLLLALPLSARSAPEVTAGFLHETLNSGLRVSILSDPLMPVVATQHWVDVGSAHEQPDERGLAHLFEHLMFGATASTEDGEYGRLHTLHGGRKNAYTSRTHTVYLSEILPEHHDEVLRMELARFTSLTLDEAALEVEKGVVQEELRQRTGNNPLQRIQVELSEAIFAGHPFEIPPVGTLEDLEAVTVEACQAFYDAHYRAENIHLVIAGPVHGPTMLETVRALYAELPGGARDKPEVPLLEDWDFPEEVEVTEDIPPIRVTGLSYTMPSSRHADADALELMLALIGGGESNLFREHHVTDKRRSLEGFAQGSLAQHGGRLLFASLSLPTRSADKAFKLLNKSVTELSDLDWLTPEALAPVRRRALRGELSGLYYAKSMASRVGGALFEYGDVARAFDSQDRLAAVTVDDIRRVWTTWITDARPMRVHAHKD